MAKKSRKRPVEKKPSRMLELKKAFRTLLAEARQANESVHMQRIYLGRVEELTSNLGLWLVVLGASMGVGVVHFIPQLATGPVTAYVCFTVSSVILVAIAFGRLGDKMSEARMSRSEIHGWGEHLLDED